MPTHGSDRARGALFAIVMVASAVSAQSRWAIAHTAPPGLPNVRAEYHAALGRVVVVAARPGTPTLETWEWHAGEWQRRWSANAPPTRQAFALTYDAARGALVLFGGVPEQGGVLSDTWEWDGINWQQARPIAAPPARYATTLAFDGRRRRVILIGGMGDNGLLADHWEWDGVAWTLIAMQSPLGARSSIAATYDQARSQVVLFGGQMGLVSRDDTWVYDAGGWRDVTPATRPPGVAAAAMTYDATAGVCVAYGGRAPFVGPSTQVWEWNGAQWALRGSATNPGERLAPAFAYDPHTDRCVLLGGTYESSTWLWDRAGAAWTRLAPTQPRLGAGAPATHTVADSSLVVAANATFEWDHARRTWSSRPSAAHPPSILRASMTFDAARSEAVLFGARSYGAAETWTRSQATGAWQQRTPAVSPPGIEKPALAYDVNRDRVVLFGGSRAGVASAETWEWDGSNWHRQTPPTSPPARDGCTLAFDLFAARVVLFGGGTMFGNFNDVWDWDGSDWQQRPIANAGPSPRNGAVWGGTIDGLILQGGQEGFNLFADAWVLRGNTWQQLSATNGPPGTQGAVVVHPLRAELVVIGGAATSTGVWVHGIPAAAQSPIGAVCPFGARGPTLRGVGVPSIGNPAYALRSTDLIAQSPALFLFGRDPALAALPNGCRLTVWPPIATVVMGAGNDGVATLGLPIPGLTRLTGAVLHAQVATVDASRVNLVVSPVLRLELGY